MVIRINSPFCFGQQILNFDFGPLEHEKALRTYDLSPYFWTNKLFSDRLLEYLLHKYFSTNLQIETNIYTKYFNTNLEIDTNINTERQSCIMPNNISMLQLEFSVKNLVREVENCMCL